MSDKPWNPEVERIRKAMMERFSDKLSMEEIAEFAYSVAEECTAPAPQTPFWVRRTVGCPNCGAEIAKAFCVEKSDLPLAAATPQVTPRMSVEARDWMWMRELANHWLSGIQCNHAKKTDVASCACGWTDGPRMTVGTAVKTWVRHVQEIVNASLPKDSEGA